MVEESPESFIARWRAYAADVEMFAHTEGSPLLECRVGDTVLQLFERTGPYLSRPGPTKLIINPTTAELEKLDGQAGHIGIQSHGLSDIVAIGRVTTLDDGVVVIDAGVPLVVSLSGSSSLAIAAGDLVRLQSEGPVHGFVVTQANGAASRRRAEAADEGI